MQDQDQQQIPSVVCSKAKFSSHISQASLLNDVCHCQCPVLSSKGDQNLPLSSATARSPGQYSGSPVRSNSATEPSVTGRCSQTTGIKAWGRLNWTLLIKSTHTWSDRKFDVITGTIHWQLREYTQSLHLLRQLQLENRLAWLMSWFLAALV